MKKINVSIIRYTKNSELNKTHTCRFCPLSYKNKRTLDFHISARHREENTKEKEKKNPF